MTSPSDTLMIARSGNVTLSYSIADGYSLSTGESLTETQAQAWYDTAAEQIADRPTISYFTCPKCGGHFFGRDPDTNLVRCHGPSSLPGPRCDWRGEWPPIDETRIYGLIIQHDPSGQGRAWRDVDAQDLPASVREEIATEIAEGNDDCDNYTATNGQHYRW